MTNVLLVDDSPVDLLLFAGLLKKDADFVVRTCKDGKTALESMESELPDIVITDMQMPEMDGLELVKQVRERFTTTPIILITGHGSEDLATQALRAGAAGYVPKSQGNVTLLAETVRHVLELSRTVQIDDRVNALTTQIIYDLQLENDETLIPGVLQLVRQRVSDGASADDVTLLQIEVALEQALLNAIYHGNLEFGQYSEIEFDQKSRISEAKILASQAPYADRRVALAMRVTPGEARFVIKDDGTGFDVNEVSSIGLTQCLRGEGGQGLFLMWAFMDKVAFDKSGSSVTLTKRIQPKKEDAIEFIAAEPPEEVTITLDYKNGKNLFSLTKRRITIGSDPSCDVEINSDAIAAHECLLFVHDGWWFVRDLKNKRLQEVQHETKLIEPASVFSVGPYDFKVTYDPAQLGANGDTPPIAPV